ncbi:hypothetical protein ACQ4PT_022869 [Festuca glaucescens]
MKKKNIPGNVGDEMPGGSRRRGKAKVIPWKPSQPRNCKKNSATTSVQSLRHPHHPSSLPEGVQFQLDTLPVTARCVGDGDGFTAHVEEDSKVVNGSNNGVILAGKYKIRMRGIDAPELKMEYGMEARNELVNLIEGKCVMIYVYEEDQYERYIGDVYCGGVFIQEEMLKRGFAWYCKIYDKRCEFEQWEREARDARRGLWLSDNPKKPWEWKRDHPRNTQKQDCIQMDNGSCEALSWMIKEKKNYEEEAMEWKKKWESVVAENQMLNDQLRESKEALSIMIKETNNSEEKSTEWKKKWRSAVAENQMLIRELKEVIQNEEKACRQRLKRRVIWVGTSMLAVGIAVLCIKWKTPPKKKGTALLYHYARTRIW